jgi:hypothetical protein
MWNPSSPVTGGAQTGLTSPTYTLTLGRAPDGNGTQHLVTALGGTQTGVRTHSVSDPFTLMVKGPANPRVLPSPNPTTGKYGAIPRNVTTLVARKGVNYAASNAPDVCLIRCEISVPAGSDSYDSANVRAAISLMIGALYEQSSNFGDGVILGQQ